MAWDGLLYRAEVTCECGTKLDFVAEHPPIPMIVVGFYDDDGEGRGDTCPNCDRELVVPDDSPHDRSHRNLIGDAEAAGCRCKKGATDE